MEIQEFDFAENLPLNPFNVSLPTAESVALNEIVTSSSGSGWRRLKSENMGSPSIDPLWVNKNSAKITDVDKDLDIEIYEKTKNALAKSGIPSLADHTISNEEIDALTPLIQKIVDLVTPRDEDTKAKKKEKIDFLAQLGNHGVGQDAAAKKLLEKDIEELKVANNTLVCGKGKHKGTMGKIGHKVTKFWKKHKVAIIVTAVVIAVAAVLVVVALPTAAGVVASAGEAGAKIADSAANDKPPPKPKPAPVPTVPIPTAPPEPPPISYPFETFDPYPYPGKPIFDDKGVYCDGKFTSFDDTLSNPPSAGDKSWAKNWLDSIETTKNDTPASFPHVPKVNPPSHPTTSNRNGLSTQELKAIDYQTIGNLALATGNYEEALQNFNKAIEMEPTDTHSYLGKGATHFELGEYDSCVIDYNQYTALAPKEFSVTDFSVGFAKGLPQGIYESGEGLLLFLGDLVTNPVQTGTQVYESFSTLSKFAAAGEWETIGATLSPEVHELITQWDTLSDSKKGELAGFAFGKHGADFLLPGAATKVALKGSTAVKELGAVCKNLQSAEKTFVLESVANGANSGIDIAKSMASAEKTLAGGEDLGLTFKQMAEYKQAGTLEEVVGKGRDYFAGKPDLQASFDLFNDAKKGLEPYIKIPMAEEQIRNHIQKHNIPTFARPTGIPENYLVKITDRGAGMEYVNPTNSHLSVRVMPGKPHSPHPHQQKPYVIQMKSGKAMDKYGNLLAKEAPEAHIPLEEFILME